MPFKIVRNDITKMKVDAIVNTANPEPIYASGTDCAIYEAAGVEELLRERRKIGYLHTGKAAITPAFALDAKYIIHTVGPAFLEGDVSEEEALRQCYANSLKLARDYHCDTIAFPLISTGIYGYPKQEALHIAVSEISKFLLKEDMTVYLVVFDQESFELSGKLFMDVDSYIDEHYVQTQSDKEYLDDYEICARFMEFDKNYDLFSEDEHEEDEFEDYDSKELVESKLILPSTNKRTVVRNIDDVVAQIGESFQERLFRLIDERGMTDVEVYKRANIGRKLFSKIRCNSDYKPKKRTAMALAIALKLNLDETKDLLSRAELALSPSSKFDLILEYFIDKEVYDVYTINLALFEHDLPILGE